MYATVSQNQPLKSFFNSNFEVLLTYGNYNIAIIQTKTVRKVYLNV